MARSAPAESCAAGPCAARALSTAPRRLATLALVPTVVLVWGNASCAKPVETYTGTLPVVREARPLRLGSAAPTEVTLSGPLDFEVRAGRTFAVWLDGHADLLPHIEVTVDGDELSVEVLPHVRLVPPPHVEIELPDLGVVRLTGSGNARLVDVDADRLHLFLSGSGDLSASGQARVVDLTMRGSGDVDLDGLTALRADVDKMGSGSARIAASQLLRGRLMGSGNLVDTVGATEVDVTSVGSGAVERALTAPAR